MSGSLIKIDNPFEPLRRNYISIPQMEGRSIYELIEYAEENRPVVVLVNGILIEDYNTKLRSNDVIHMYPRLEKDAVKAVGLIGLAVLASYVISPYVSGVVTAQTGSALLGSVAGGVAAAAVITAGGLLLNPGLSGGGRNSSTSEDSPTYHWDIDANPAREGLAIPVIYGNVITKPIIINQWIEIDDSNDQWAHTTLLVAEGETNNEPTADDIYADDQLLSFYDASDYVLVTTDGSDSPDWSSNTDFTTPHQMRSIDRYLYYSRISSLLLSLNGTDGSTTIIDQGGLSNNWTCQNNADLTTSPVKFGTACADLTASNAYISCDNEEAFDIWTESHYTIECWFRASVVDDHALIGAERSLPGGNRYCWGLFIENGNSIVFNQFKRASDGDHTHYYYKSESATLNADTWYHICVQRKPNAGVQIYLDGGVLGSPTGTSNSRVDPPSGTWAQAVGKARLTNGVESSENKYGDCYIDDARIIIAGIAYSWSGFSKPSSTLPADNDEDYIFSTKGVVDKFTLIFNFPYGLYSIQDDSSLDDEDVRVQVAYRKINTSDWSTDDFTLESNTRNPYKEQKTYTMPERGKYDIRVRRLSKNDDDTRKQSTLLLQFIDEFLDIQLNYPRLQCIGISLKAQELASGRIPTYSVVSNRNSITVPNYSGNKISTQTVNPTVNAYGAIDVLTNTVYGPGVNISRIPEDDWEDWADWTNTTVEGNKRSQLNIVFDSIQTVDEALQQIEDCGRARIVKRGTDFSVIINQPTSASALFGAGNVVPQSDHVKWVRQAERSDAVEVTYRDINLNYIEQTVRYNSSTYRSLTRQPRIVRLNMYGINNKDQALREATLRQQISESIKKAVELESGLEAIPVTSGDVINYQASINSFSGRLPIDNNRDDEWTGTTVYLDQEINLDSTIFSGNCILMVRDSDDTLQSYVISGPFDTDTWTVTITSSGTFNQYAPYTICRSTGDVYQYKIEEIKRSSNLDIKISALQYDENAYYNTKYESGSVAI